MDKPVGPTSHDVVAVVRRTVGVRRIGHTGTLDPFASGLLVLLVGRATRLAPFLTGMDKSYRGVLRLGATSDTDDLTGTIQETSPGKALPGSEDVARAMGGLTGDYQQRPPAYSAKKVAGERAYRRARRGQSVALPGRAVRVHRFDFLRQEDGDVEFAADVGSGTYIRALARDLGAQLGCGAYLRSLRRTTVGPFRVEDAVCLDELTPQDVPLRCAAEGVAHLPRIDVDDDTRRRVCHGQPVAAASQAPSGAVALMAGGELIAVAEREGEVFKPRVVLSG